MPEQEARDELNRLYWESDESVADIADRLDISRRALYDGIEPRPAGASCPDCGASLGYRNRTAEENREAECPECGRKVELPAEVEARQAVDDAPFEDPTVEQEQAAAAMAPARRVPPAGGSALLGLMLLLGIGIGALIAFLLRRR